MEVMITCILYFILYGFYFSTELLDYSLNIIILSNSHSFIPDACSYRSVIFNFEMSRLRFAPLDIRGMVGLFIVVMPIRYKGNTIDCFYVNTTIPLLRPCGEVSGLGYLFR